MVELFPSYPVTTITIIGVDDFGGKILVRIKQEGLRNVRLVNANGRSAIHPHLGTTLSSQDSYPANLNDGLIKDTSRPKEETDAASVDINRLREAMIDSDMILIVAEILDGHDAAASLIGSVAKEMGILTVGIVSRAPSSNASSEQKADAAPLKTFKANADSTFIIDGPLEEREDGGAPKTTHLLEPFNETFANFVLDLCKAVNIDAADPVDFEDLKTVLTEAGNTTIGFGKATGLDRARVAAEQALAAASANGMNPLHAKCVLMLRKVAPSCAWLELRESLTVIKKAFSPEAHIIHAVVEDVNSDEDFQVTLFVSGLPTSCA